jgi:YHS domain-containing protein
VGPLRILILAALLYIGYRLISANFKKDSGDQTQAEKEKSEGQKKTPEADAGAEAAADAGTITDVLVEDPVCGRLVPKQQARIVESDGEPHFFCSQECADAFVADKEKND